MTTSDRDVVAALGQAMAQRIGEPRYQLWFAPNTKFAWDAERLVVGVPNHFFQEWLEKTFGEAVRAAASEVLGRPMQVRFSIDPELFQAARRAEKACRGSRIPDRELQSDNQGSRIEDRRLMHEGRRLEAQASCRSSMLDFRPSQRSRRWHRLQDFVVGTCNRLAHASALHVIEAPGETANPLVLYGPVGTGKTHLLEGIYGGMRKAYPQWRVCFTTTEGFTNRFLQALRLGKLPDFRQHFRECDALLVDDLQFLARKRATEEEFLHTFDALQADGKQIVVTCDCHPKLAGEFTPLLTDRLAGGAVWGLTPPDLETRKEILRHKASQREPPVTEDVIGFIASQLRGNVRELEGALQTVRHVAQVAGRRLDAHLAREALGDLVRHAVTVVQLDDVNQAVCRALRLEGGALQAKQRAWAISHPRMLAMFLARKHTAAAYSEIGRYFGGRNHSTAVSADKKVRQWLLDDEVLALGEQRLHVREVIELVERELLR